MNAVLDSVAAVSTPPSAAAVRKAVDRGLEIRAQIEALEAEMGEIESTLRAAGLAGEQVELNDTERDGRQFLAGGTVHIVPVVFTSDLVAQSFQDGSAVHLRAQDAAAGLLTEFYRPVTTWKMLARTGKAFRRDAAALLSEKAPAFVSACLQRDKNGIPKSQIKVEWDRAEARN
jgi:hypothetical protein